MCIINRGWDYFTFLDELSFSYKLIKMLSVWMCVHVWMLTRVEQNITAAHRDLYSYKHSPTNKP